MRLSGSPGVSPTPWVKANALFVGAPKIEPDVRTEEGRPTGDWGREPGGDKVEA